MRLFVPICALVYVLVGFGRWVTYRPEVYPITAWGMFQRVKRSYPEYDLSVHRLAGRDLSHPLSLRTSRGRTDLTLSGHLTLVLNGFVRDATAGRADEAARYRRFLDVVGPDTGYVVVLRRRRTRPIRPDRVTTFGPFVTGAQVSHPDRVSFEGRRFARRPPDRRPTIKIRRLP